MIAQLYNCPNCGPVWRVYEYEEIDCDRDDIEVFMNCASCDGHVSPVMKDGKQVYHGLTDEEIEEELIAQELADDDDC